MVNTRTPRTSRKPRVRKPLALSGPLMDWQREVYTDPTGGGASRY